MTAPLTRDWRGTSEGSDRGAVYSFAVWPLDESVVAVILDAPGSVLLPVARDKGLAHPGTPQMAPATRTGAEAFLQAARRREANELHIHRAESETAAIAVLSAFGGHVGVKRRAA